jgi:hypothetical protein
MVTSYNGSSVLKKYQLTSDEERSYILGFPYIITAKTKRKDVAYSEFSARVIKNIKESAFNRGAADVVIEQAANSAVKSNTWNFGQSKLQDGFFFPKLSADTPGEIEKIKKILKSNELVIIRYLSARVGASGSPILVKKIYVGRVTGISEDERVATLQLSDSDYRSFHINQMIVLSNFSDALSDGEMLYLHVKLTPRAKGGTLLTWSTLRGESNPLLTQPFHQDVDAPKRAVLLSESKKDSSEVESKKDKQPKKKKSEDDFDDFLVPRGGEINWDGLEAHLGKFIRLEIYTNTECRETHYFKLKAMEFHKSRGTLVLKGKGVHVEESLKNLVIASVKRRRS